MKATFDVNNGKLYLKVREETEQDRTLLALFVEQSRGKLLCIASTSWELDFPGCANITITTFEESKKAKK